MNRYFAWAVTGIVILSALYFSGYILLGSAQECSKYPNSTCELNAGFKISNESFFIGPQISRVENNDPMSVFEISVLNDKNGFKTTIIVPAVSLAGIKNNGVNLETTNLASYLYRDGALYALEVKNDFSFEGYSDFLKFFIVRIISVGFIWTCFTFLYLTGIWLFVVMLDTVVPIFEADMVIVRA